MNQHKRQFNLHEQIEQWQYEVKINGTIQNEKRLYECLHKLDEHEDFKEYSSLLAIAALSRINKQNEHESLAIAWMEKAKEIDPNNKLASQFIAQTKWKTKKDLLSQLTFPSIRETDHRQLKKQTAQQIITIANDFLKNTSKELEEIEALSYGVTNVEISATYESMIQYLHEAVEEVNGVINVMEEYEQSASANFYNTTFYFDFKQHLEKIENIKAEWATLFLEKEKEDRDSALKQLDQMIGMSTVKKRVKDFYKFLQYQKERKEKGFQMKDEISLNLVLTGNPGTGKTTLARLLAKIYNELGVLPRKEVIEVDRSQLVGAYVGQTEENVRKFVEQALGGILFIDEAYSLKREGQTGNDYGQTAIDTLVSLMTGKEYGGKFAVILAGYPDEMRHFLDSNPGLRSRFPESNFFHLEDYTTEELLQIAEKIAEENDYIITEDGKKELAYRLEQEKVDDTFGNGRTVRNIILDAIFKKGAKEEKRTNILAYTLLDKEDFYVEKKADKKDPQKQLNELVGLENIKKEVKRLIAFIKMQQYRRENNLPVLPLQLHSVFTGNPGTGKTTVAKIYAEFLKECGFLKRGHLIVTSRADLVAEYVGQTAVKTKKKIREALGGVLFIDEAYSLLSESAGDFGKEAIDTLVDEMTKHDNNLVVILAGYPNEIDKFLNSNPGLKSRFKKFFRFQDYTTEEIIRIMKLYSLKYDYIIEEEGLKYLHDTLKSVPIHGNGRFATNFIDEAIQAQASRLMEQDLISMKEDEAKTIKKEDLKQAWMNMRNGE